MLIAEAYSAFNRRDIDGALALMSENVSWQGLDANVCCKTPGRFEKWSVPRNMTSRTR